VRFLVDAQLPPQLARWLTGAGHVAEHVADCGLTTADDLAIWSHAAEIGAVIVTKDEDFALRKAIGKAGPPVVWIRLGNTRGPELLRWFETMFPAVLAALERGETLVEID